MKCPRCTHQNPAGVMFCNTCRQMIGALFTHCKTVNLPECNFCNQCGQFLSKINASFSDQGLSNPLFPDTGKSAIPQTASGARKYNPLYQ